MKQLTLDLAGTPPATLDNFVAGRNAELLHHLKQLAARATGEHFIYVWGMPGSGRSHLLRATVAAVKATGGDPAYVECSGDAPFAGVTPPLSFLAIDDVERLGAQAQVELFNIYNSLRENGGALLASGNAPPAQLELREDVVTRLGWGLVYQVHPLSDEEKTQALRRHAAARGFALSDEVCGYLLQRVRRDMPSLLTMLDALDRYSLETKREVTVPLVRELLHTVPRAEGAARRLVLFDLDNTLLAGDSDFEWAQFLIEQGVLDREVYAARNQAFYDQYRAGALDILEFLNFQLKPLSRHPRAVLDAWHREFMRRKIVPLIRQGARDLVERHRGDTRVVITATNSFVTAPIARAFGIEHLIATEPEVRDGEFTGGVAGVPCFREGKVRCLESWLAGQGRTLESFGESWFYSDSLNDLPLLARVTHPVAVDPDATLRAHAESHGWPVMTLG